ncbi:hypothetical protein A2U01_0031573, partial [Trifolium medium]|nr:hypothetical protein [Trifolium medium]
TDPLARLQSGLKFGKISRDRRGLLELKEFTTRIVVSRRSEAQFNRLQKLQPRMNLTVAKHPLVPGKRSTVERK